MSSCWILRGIYWSLCGKILMGFVSSLKGRLSFHKLKLVSSIVAISGIHLLKIFFGLENYTQNQLLLFIAVHFTFVLSGVLLAYMDSLTAKGKK